LINDIPHKFFKLHKNKSTKTIRIGKLNFNDQYRYAELICRIYKSIPLDPVKCSSCYSIYCKDELLAWAEMNNINCPKGCHPSLFTNKPLNLTHNEIVIWESITIKCECGIYVSRVKSDYASCEFHNNYSCLFCSEEEYSLDAIEKHAEYECERRHIFCEYCNISIRKNQEVLHQAKCELLCSGCSRYVLRRQMSEHKLSKCPLSQMNILERYINQEKAKSLSLKSIESIRVEELLSEEKSQNIELFKEYVRNDQKDYENFKNILAEREKVIDDNIKFSDKVYNELIEKNLPGVKDRCISSKVFGIVCLIFIFIIILVFKAMDLT
jgi:hypothetical protein